MKLKFVNRIALSLTLLLSGAAHAEIKQIQTMTEILPYVTADTLLVFDLDNTVINPIQTLGSDQWFQYLLKSNSVDQSVAIWSQIQPYTRVEAVEAVTPDLIANAQENGLKVMALTARPSTLADTTISQLASVGVDFLMSPVYDQDVNLGDDTAPKYISGIEFVSPKFTKGDALVAFLNRIGYKPRRVVFVDDTPKHTVTVNQALDAAGIENFEFRYGADDAKVAAFNPPVAQKEYEIFEHCGNQVISDSEALELTHESSFRCP